MESAEGPLEGGDTDSPGSRSEQEPPLGPPRAAGRFQEFLAWWARMRMADWVEDGYL
ncbi:hypothetical protein AB0K43_03015 [Kitasatospora sp. NPDC049258]|uniref:hypothetical protein n=1 Tax=Kitasatospora sp. NPDC049258 TaxID=3155394 RepID=UPI003421AA63